nr:sensor histidine kinase [Pararoseomonas baculiformis]
MPADALDTPVSRSLLVLGAVVLLSLAVATGLSAAVSRDLARRRDERERLADLALRASEERERLALEAAELGAWQFDAARDVLTGSPRSRELLGLAGPPAGERDYPAAALLARVHRHDRAVLKAAARRCLEANEPIDLEFRAVLPSGEARWLRARGRYGDPAEGEPGAIRGVLADISPQKRAEAERAGLRRRLADAEEKVRGQIARDLHDGIGQAVTGLSLGLGALERSYQAGGNDAGDQRAAIRRLRDIVAEIGRDLHRTAAALRPTALDDVGLTDAVGSFVVDWQANHGIAVDVRAKGLEGKRLPPDIETVAYRVIQEALTNILRHAGARAVSILLELRDGALRLAVEDDGRGFDPEAAAGEGPPHRPRLGLAGLRERVALAGGTLSLASKAGRGTTLSLTLPLRGGGA